MVLKLHISKPLEKLREMLAESEHMQTLMGIDTESDTADDDTADKVLYGYAEDSPAFDEGEGDQAVKQLPRCLIATEDFNSSVEATSSWSTEVVMSVFIQCLTLTADKTKSLSERYKSFLDRVEGVCDDLRELASDNTRLNLRSIRTDIPPHREDIKETGGIEIFSTVFIVVAGG